jgi:glucose/mannose transport system substrate-binding protein
MNRTFRADRVHRTAVLRFALLGALALVLVVPAAGFAGQAKKAAPQTSTASCQLQVFSWWTGGGEAAGLTKLIAIWNKGNPTCKFKNDGRRRSRQQHRAVLAQLSPRTSR